MELKPLYTFLFLFFALFLEAKEHRFSHCDYDGKQLSPVGAEYAESECLGDAAEYFQDLVHLKEKELLQKLPKKLHQDFKNTQQSWQKYVEENSYEYAYFVGGYPYVIELQTFKINETLKRLDEIENLLQKYGRCSVDDTACLQQQFEQSDKVLNRVYKKVFHQLPSGLAQKLRATQRKWIRYKQKECSLFVTDSQEYFVNKKSMKNKKLICQTQLTQKRVKELTDIEKKSKR